VFFLWDPQGLSQVILWAGGGGLSRGVDSDRACSLQGHKDLLSQTPNATSEGEHQAGGHVLGRRGIRSTAYHKGHVPRILKGSILVVLLTC
jgi:hypothetical protein